MTRLPPPEQWVLSTMNEMEVAEMIEKHIEHYAVDKDGNRRPVHLPDAVRAAFHEAERSRPADSSCDRDVAIVLADGGLLAPTASIACAASSSSSRTSCARSSRSARTARRRGQGGDGVPVRRVAGRRRHRLTGKCIIIAAALTLIERSLLDQRPCFFVTAGRRGGGKTTALTMLIMAVTGMRPAAAAWSTNEEERRKALLAYFLDGVPYILWDNIARGTQISCPHIEKSCTAAYYSDRKLGVSEMVCTAASTIHLFTGNNIGPKGDLASRSLHIRLDVDRADPENRKFRHPTRSAGPRTTASRSWRRSTPSCWAIPQLKATRDAEGKTRFKMWWRLVGSAVENAARLDRARARLPETVHRARGGRRGIGIARRRARNPGEDSGRTQFMASDVAGMINNRYPEWRRADVARLFAAGCPAAARVLGRNPSADC